MDTPYLTLSLVNLHFDEWEKKGKVGLRLGKFLKNSIFNKIEFFKAMQKKKITEME